MKTHNIKAQGPLYEVIRKHSKWLTTGLFAAVGICAAPADSLTWDPALTGGSGGNGTWDFNTTANWYNTATALDEKWADNSLYGTNSAIFGGVAGVVTLNSSLTTSNLQFTTAGYTLFGTGVLTLGAGGIDGSVLASGTTTVSNALLLTSAQRQVQAGAGSTLAINGTVTRNAGAGVDFTSTGITSTTLTNDGAGIIDGWATTGNYVSSTTTGDFLTVSNGSIITCTNYLPVSAAASSSPSLASIAGQNLVSGALNGANEITTITNNVAINSLIQQGDFNVNNGVTLTINAGGIIQRGVSRWLLDNNGGNVGSAQIMSGLASGELFIHSPDAATGNWRIWPIIADNGTTPGVLVKDGPGLTMLENHNKYTGGTYINNGALGIFDNTAGNQGNYGTGTVTVNSAGILEMGDGTANANSDYYCTNSLVFNGGKALEDDGHQHISGPISILGLGATFGSSYDGGGSASTGNKQLFVDGLVSGSGPIYLEQSSQAGEFEYNGNEGGNAFNSSVVAFGNNANTYSGAVTVIPYQTGSGAGSYLAINGSTALQYATLNLTNNTGGHRYAALGGVYSALVFNTGLGSATVGAIEGSGNIILNGFNENTYGVSTDSIAFTVGGNNASTTESGIITGVGSLIKAGTGTLTLSGINTYTGSTVVNGGDLVLQGNFASSTNTVVAAGATLDVSALGSITLGTFQNLLNGGTVNGSITTGGSSGIYANTGSGYGTNKITGNLTISAGSTVYLNVGTVHNGANDLISVGGTLSANGNIINLSAPSTSANLDASADYVLMTSPTPISGAFAAAPNWIVAPANSGHYSIVTSANTVTLHYAAFTAPSAGGVAAANPALRNQSVVISVTATNGTGGAVSGVTVNASLIGGSSALALTEASVNGSVSVWTNSVTVAPATLAGNYTLVATATDTASLTGIANIPLAVVTGNDVWNGSDAVNSPNFSDGLNWTNKLAPGYVGDSLEFGGSTGLAPVMDNAYTVTGLLFDSGAGAFNISSASTLTLSGAGLISNQSANAQTLSMALADAGGGLTKSGSSPLFLAGSAALTGVVRVNSGIMEISPSGSITATNFLIGNLSNSVAAFYQMGGTVSDIHAGAYDDLAIGNISGSYGYYDAAGGSTTISGIAVAGEDSSGYVSSFGSPAGNGIMDINGGSVTCSGWFVISRNSNAQMGEVNILNGSLSFAGGGMVCNWASGQTAMINVLGGLLTSSTANIELGSAGNTGILNLDGGLASVDAVSGNFGGTFGQVNFNGGDLQSQVNTLSFIHVTTATVYSGGGIIDNNGYPISINQPLLAPAGMGLSKVTAFTGGAGYIAPPIVIITPGAGDTTGHGATAMAQVDPLTGMVTNIIVTCPGQNYTVPPVFTFSGGGAVTPAAVTSSTLATNVSGGLTFTGFSGVATTISNACTYTGSTIVSNTTLALAGSLLSTNIIVDSGSILDVSSVSYTLGSQELSGFGNVNGSVNTSGFSRICGGDYDTAAYGTNTFNNNLTLVGGATCDLALGSTYNGANSQIVVNGTLTANGNSFRIKAPSANTGLDTTADYVLITSLNPIVGSFAAAPNWDLAPTNAGRYTVVTSGNTVTLHYNAAAAAPTITATVNPSTVLRNQPTVLTASVVPGSASISSVTVNLSSLGGSIVTLVQSNLSNIYTNSFVIPPTAATGNSSVTVTVTDSASQTGAAIVPLTINSSTETWAGAAASQDWSANADWASGYAPGFSGDTLVFAGTTGLAPNMDTNYSVGGLVFGPTAGAFTIGSANQSTLTLAAGGIVNNSPNAQIVNVPITMASAQTINASSGDINLGGVISDNGGGLTITGSHVVTLSGNNTFTGPAMVAGGTLNLTGSINPSAATVGSAAGNAVVDLAGSLGAANLFVGNASGAVAAVYQTGGSISLTNGTGDLLNVGNVTGSYGYFDAIGGVLNLNGISIGGESNPNVWPPEGSGDGIFEVHGATINNIGWIVLARGGLPENGILNMYSGLLTYSGGGLACNWQLSGTGQTSIINVMGGSITSTNQGVYFRSLDTGILNLNGGLLEGTAVGGAGTVNFNGGTLQAASANAAFLGGLNSAYIYSGGATIDNNGNSVTVTQPLLAPTGNGEHGILTLSGGSGYIAPPVITITNAAGDTNGSGATAIAQINPVTGAVTNVIMTCPGVNYSATPIFVVSGGGATVAATITGAPVTPNTGGGLTSVGTGTLTLSGLNTYSGNTTVSAGTLALSLPTLASNSVVTVNSGAALQLGFATTNTVGGLVLNGVNQPPGVYNSVNAAPYITGSGSLLVSSGVPSNPTSLSYSVSAGVLTISWPANYLGWILQSETNALSVGIRTNGWVDVAGTSGMTSTNITINKLSPTVFYRLRHP